ncbi:MAG: MBL fold metallo-hydrolase [Burkholderiales bacterium]
MIITFLGAAQEVTGSCYLVELDSTQFLVDCGLFQGGPESYRKNLAAFQFEPKEIDFVLLTHAHTDHCGLLPRLSAFGFKGPIYATDATVDLLEVMLLDSAHIQESEALWQNKRRQRERKGARADVAPLYTVAQAQECLEQLRQVSYGTEFKPHDAVRVRFQDAGHILGSAIIEVWLTENNVTKKIVFSGDLGQPGRPIVRDPTPIAEADVLLVESTYGNRLHKTLSDTKSELFSALDDTFNRKHGVVIVPAFAVGRTQELLFMLLQLSREGKLKNLNVFVDSPLGAKATKITLDNLESLDDETRELARALRGGKEAIQFRFTETVEDSMALNNIRSGAVIIAGSGMCEGGRIQHHLKHRLGDKANTIVFAGYQAEGTLGRRLVDGAKSVMILGEEIAVQADRYTLGGLSAHADQAALIAWLKHFLRPPQQTFIVHGEQNIAQVFAEKINQELGWKPTLPSKGNTYPL